MMSLEMVNLFRVQRETHLGLGLRLNLGLRLTKGLGFGLRLCIVLKISI